MKTISASRGICPIADAAAFFSSKGQTVQFSKEAKLKQAFAEEPKKTVFFTDIPGQCLRIEYRFD